LLRAFFFGVDMKIRNLFEKIGIRPKTKKYGYEIKNFKIHDININYAQWLHPSESNKKILTNEVDAYKRVISKGDFCIDIGAHSGDSTIPMAIASGKEGCVLALEPNPFVYHVLEKNIRLNRQHTNIKSIMAAATTELNHGFMDFEYSTNFCNGGKHENISFFSHGHSFTLNVFCLNLEKELQNDFPDYLPKLKFIKLDAEGYDLFILKSIKNIISRYRPLVKAEVFKDTDKKYRLNLLKFFKHHKYKVYRMIEEPIFTGERIDESNLEKWKHYDIICKPNKIYNDKNS
jgi:FkbM family methyltransferase